MFYNKTCSQKFRQIHRKTPGLESLFDTFAGLQVDNFIIKRLQYRCFPFNVTKFLRVASAMKNSKLNFDAGCIALLKVTMQRHLTVKSKHTAKNITRFWSFKQNCQSCLSFRAYSAFRSGRLVFMCFTKKYENFIKFRENMYAEFFFFKICWYTTFNLQKQPFTDVRQNRCSEKFAI